MRFLQSAYGAAVEIGEWDFGALERTLGRPGVPRPVPVGDDECSREPAAASIAYAVVSQRFVGASNALSAVWTSSPISVSP
jgi:hypothetical protein